VPLVTHFKELRVYQQAFEAAMHIFELSKRWPKEERYSLTDQIRRSSRSVCANVAEAWRKRRYVAHFVNKLSDADTEAAETQVWLDFALRCGYLGQEDHGQLYRVYDGVGGGLVKMMAGAETWCGPAKLREDDPTYDTHTHTPTLPYTHTERGKEPSEA
jgi:four helix bundle protein